MPKEKNEKVIALLKDELGEKIMKEFLGSRGKTYSYLMDDSSEDKKTKGTKTCALKGKLKFENYKNCLEATQLENKINHLEKNEIAVDSLNRDHREFTKSNKLIIYNVFTEEKVALSSNDDKRIRWKHMYMERAKI